MSSLVGGTGVIGQDMVCGFSNGKYKTFEGTEISIENCVKAKVKDLVVEGKTYQNLCIEDTSNEKSSLNFSNHSMFKIGTYYTIILEITVDNASQINLAFNTSSHVILAPKGHNKGIYKFKVRNTNTSLGEVSSVKLLSLKQEGYTTCLFKNVIVLEGDYTNIDIPNNINGIESVTEKENNVLSVKINDNVSNINLPIPLRSLPNGTCDTIEGNKLVQRVGKVVLDGSEDWKVSSINSNENGLLNIYYSLSNVVVKSQYNQSLICDKYIQQTSGIGNTTTEGILINIEKRLYLRLSLDKVTTLEEAKEYISNNPFTIYYELETPIIHSLEIPSISTTKGTNVITTSNNIKPKLKLKVKVK